EPQRLENVARRSQRRGSEMEQRIRSRRQCRRDLARDREHLSPLLARERRSDHRTASLTRLDDDRRGAETRDDAIASRETPRRGLDAGLVLRHDQRPLSDRAGQRHVRRRIVTADAAPENRNGVPPRLERTTMRFAVDPARETTDDHYPRRGEVAP